MGRPQKKPLSPRKEITSEGRIAYSEGFGAWNVLRLKKELFEEFPELKEKGSKFCYEITYFRDSKELKKAMINLEKEALPILLWLYKEK